MKRLFAVAVAALSLSAARAEPVIGGSNAAPVRVRKNAFLAKTGGMVARPGVRQGEIAFLNVRSAIPADALDGVRKSLSRMLRVSFPLRDVSTAADVGSLDAAFRRDGADFAVFIVDDGESPAPLAVYPERRFAVVNVGPLRTAGAGKAFLAARIRKEAVRGVLFVAGGASSQSMHNIMGPMFSGEDLDKVTDDAIPVDVVARAYQYLPNAGCETQALVPYSRAVREGWAPEPTNEYQRAVWERVRKIPTEPMRIEFDPKKGR